MNPLIQLKITPPPLLITLALMLIAPLPNARAVVPAPDGGYPGFTTAEGTQALQNLTSGAGNTGIGWRSLFLDSSGSFNTSVGVGALLLNNADSNTAVGSAALLLNTTGTENTAVGTGAGPNVVVGFNNTYIGDFVGTLAADESDTIRIGDLSNGNGAGSLQCYIGGIFNNFQPVGGSVVEVTIDLADDHLGWDIGPSQRGSAATRPAMLNGKVGKVEKLEATVAQQQKQIETLTAQLREQADTFTAQLREQAAQIRKVSAQFEASKPAPQVVNNP